MPTPTREQLASIEWRGDDPHMASCPACSGAHPHHWRDCWLAACLVAPPPEPQAMPPKWCGSCEGCPYPDTCNYNGRCTVWTREPRR